MRTDNVRHWQPFQDICRKHGIPPTYLITYEVAADTLAQGLLRSWIRAGEAEVGAHLHPWTTPPFRDDHGFRYNDSWHAYASELPEELIRKKLSNLTSQIETNLNVRPRAYRAGRFGFDLRAARILAELGYLVDSSVTPLLSWRSYPGLPTGPGGPDFSSHPARPFRIEGAGGLLEIPVTVVPTYPVLRYFPALLTLYRTRPLRAVRRLLFSRWASPQPVMLQPADLDYPCKELCRAYEYQSQEADVAVMMVHSSELMPGGSPQTPTRASVSQVLDRLDAFLGFVRARGAQGVTLSQAAEALRSRNNLEVRAL